MSIEFNAGLQSHLLQMRGLKHRDAAVFKLQQESHLLQMRGLKLKAQVSETWSRTSHLLQMRGLKHKWLNRQEEQHPGRIFYRCVD